MTKIARITGFVPPHLLLQLAARNPNQTCFLETLATTQKLYTGRVLLPHSGEKGNGTREVYNANNSTTRPGTKARFEGGAKTGDKAVDDAYDFTGFVRDFYLNVHGRNSIDGNGMTMISTVHYDKDYDNAFWDSVQMTYGDGDGRIFGNFVILDVCGHEITHGVTEKEAGFEYQGQPGALNESLSDVFGKLIEAHSKKQKVDQIDWVLGRGIFVPGIKGEGIRNMMKPGTAYDDPSLGKDPQPAHMKDFVDTWDDNGGVHYNSGITNRAFALFATEVGGYAWEKAGQIWYAARKASGSKPSFAEFAGHTVKSCGPLGFGNLEATLTKAWDAVGVTADK